MILQLFILFLIVVLFLLSMSISICGNKKPFSLKGKCVQKCNPGMVLDSKNRCVYSRPQDTVLNQKYNPLVKNDTIGRCANCPQGLVSYKDQCLQKCPEDAKVVDIRTDGLVCVKECPSFKNTVVDRVDGISYCIPNCESDSLYDPVTLRCVEKCNVYAPFETVKDGVRICDNMCPSYYTAENKCVDVCAPELVKYHNNKTYCGKCPVGSSISASNPNLCVDDV